MFDSCYALVNQDQTVTTSNRQRVYFKVQEEQQLEELANENESSLLEQIDENTYRGLGSGGLFVRPEPDSPFTYENPYMTSVARAGKSEWETEGTRVKHGYEISLRSQAPPKICRTSLAFEKFKGSRRFSSRAAAVLDRTNYRPKSSFYLKHQRRDDLYFNHRAAKNRFHFMASALLHTLMMRKDYERALKLFCAIIRAPSTEFRTLHRVGLQLLSWKSFGPDLRFNSWLNTAFPHTSAWRESRERVKFTDPHKLKNTMFLSELVLTECRMSGPLVALRRLDTDIQSVPHNLEPVNWGVLLTLAIECKKWSLAKKCVHELQRLQSFVPEYYYKVLAENTRYKITSQQPEALQETFENAASELNGSNLDVAEGSSDADNSEAPYSDENDIYGDKPTPSVSSSPVEERDDEAESSSDVEATTTDEPVESHDSDSEADSGIMEMESSSPPAAQVEIPGDWEWSDSIEFGMPLDIGTDASMEEFDVGQAFNSY